MKYLVLLLAMFSLGNTFGAESAADPCEGAVVESNAQETPTFIIDEDGNQVPAPKAVEAGGG